jgi:hypothetical protein
MYSVLVVPYAQPRTVAAMRKILITAIIAASTLSVSTPAMAAKPAVSRECAKATYTATLETGRLGASKVVLAAAKATKADAVKRRNAIAIAAAEKRVQALTQEVAAQTVRMKAASENAKAVCKMVSTTKP